MAYLNKKNIIEIINNTNGILKFHIKYKNGNARIVLNDRKTKYYTGGSGYDKESAIIAELINDLLGAIDYKSSYTGTNNGIRQLSYGIGFDAVRNALKTIGSKIEKIYVGDDFDVYELNLSNHLERINNETNS